MSSLEELFAFQLKAHRIKFEREVRLDPSRRFRWDFVVGDLAIEVQGGQWRAKGAHNTGKAMGRDAEKGFIALKAGFRPLSITGDQVKSGVGLIWVESLMRTG